MTETVTSRNIELLLEAVSKAWPDEMCTVDIVESYGPAAYPRRMHSVRLRIHDAVLRHPLKLEQVISSEDTRDAAIAAATSSIPGWKPYIDSDLKTADIRLQKTTA